MTDPVRILIEDGQPSARVAAHCELARRAEDAHDLARALRHYREAVLLSPKNPRIVARMQDIEADLGRVESKRRGMLARWVYRG